MKSLYDISKQYKKAAMLLKINLISLILIPLAFAPFHLPLLSSKPILFLGDMLLAVCFAYSLLLIQNKKAQTAVTLTAVAIYSMIFLQNVIGDLLLPSQATASRFLESVIVVTFSLPLIISFSFRRFHIYISAFMSEISLISHFVVLRYVVKVNISSDMLLFTLFIILLAFAGLINLKVTNEAIKSLMDSRKQISDWNKVLEDTVALRTMQLEAISQTDGLTNIANRRKFDTHLLLEWNRAKRSNSHIAVFILDVDQFKLYNDTFGHQQGDLCLQLVAAKLAEFARRSGDIVARYGGEEFALVMSGIDATKALDFGERVRCAVEGLEIQHSKTANFSVVTVSIGIAVCQINDHDTPETCLEAADRALYSAKHLGRNRVELSRQ